MPERAWPTRAEWQAKAAADERGRIHRWQRVTNPLACLSGDELDYRRALAARVARRTRQALTTAQRYRDRLTLDHHSGPAFRTLTDVRTLAGAWGCIAELAESASVSMPSPGDSDEVTELAEAAEELFLAHASAADRAEAEAVRRAVAYRTTDTAWTRELERRERIERGARDETAAVCSACGAVVQGTAQPGKRPTSPAARPQR